MSHEDALNNLDRALIRHNLDNGGLLSLSWEELNEQEDRDESLYTQEQSQTLLNSLLDLLLPQLSDEDKELIEVELVGCGLCIEIPPINEELVNQVMDVLSVTLSDEDIESLEWDVCNPDGTSYY